MDFHDDLTWRRHLSQTIHSIVGNNISMVLNRSLLRGELNLLVGQIAALLEIHLVQLVEVAICNFVRGELVELVHVSSILGHVIPHNVGFFTLLL